MQTDYVTPAGATIGHVHLKVANIDRALEFYHKLLGFEIIERYGEDAVFISAGGYHHHIALNTWHSKDMPPAPKNHAGLYHVAILYPERKDLSAILRRVQDAGIKLEGAADHGVSEAVYFSDPDGNGVELYWDKPREIWPRDTDGKLTLTNDRLDIDGLLSLTA
ncbi:glyoxalase [Amylibacter sp. SFDW26]|uniref:VOC family protein n=1 Tax=Amylibacter sp. SFDW26 TaxID=2652722 RepID=UPI0012626970|nr:VOC family protein [Amylibacter sp. SFDW26]KAB7615631.1 glyoxalase [Amylibacter sp. SFDW26]